MQMVVSANGHHKVPFVDLVISGKVGWRVTQTLAYRAVMRHTGTGNADFELMSLLCVAESKMCYDMPVRAC